jgi:hypothetical protein
MESQVRKGRSKKVRELLPAHASIETSLVVDDAAVEVVAETSTSGAAEESTESTSTQQVGVAHGCPELH